MIGSEEMVRLGDEWKGKIIIRQLEQLPRRRKKARYYKKTSAENQVKGKEIEVISLEEELEEFRLSGGDDYETVDKEAGNTSGLEDEEEEESPVDIISMVPRAQGVIRRVD